MIKGIVLLFILLPFTLHAGPADDAWNAWLSGDFDRVVKIVEESGGNLQLPDLDRARIYFTLGCAEAMRGKEDPATAAFKRALSLYPNFTIASDELPPPVWRLYSQLRASQPATQLKPPVPIQETMPRVDTVKVFVPLAHSKSAAIRSLVAPGWGHLMEGDKRGWWLMGTEACLLGGWIATASTAATLREDYLKARDSKEVSRKYNEYNTYHKLSWGFGIAVVAWYAGVQYDFFATPPNLQIGLGQIKERPSLVLSISM